MTEADITEKLQAYDCFFREAIRREEAEIERLKRVFHTRHYAHIAAYRAAQAEFYKLFPDLKTQETKKKCTETFKYYPLTLQIYPLHAGTLVQHS